MNIIEKIYNNSIDIEELLKEKMDHIFCYGPNDPEDLEIITYIKIYYPDIFHKYERSILLTMGLFFKKIEPQSFRDIVFKIYKDNIQNSFDNLYTPVQVKILRSISNNKNFSFSSPTSTGKSFVFRHLISSFDKDVVIIVPSRALINEYYVVLSSIYRENNVNVLTYVDLINRKKVKRNIFIITPERTKDLFKLKEFINVDMILFDEAQLSDDYSVRGLYYDSVIRRCVKNFPNSKLVFAYPFVDNPDVQYVKNNISYSEKDYEKYEQRNVGQIFFSFDDSGFYHFGIGKDNSKGKVKINYDPLEKLLQNGGSALIYCSKSKIYERTIFDEFRKYIYLCKEINDNDALKLIDKLRVLIGAGLNNNGDYSSKMIEMLKRGIVIHHGSLPLNARYVIEEFTKKGYCKMCFATSTLEQGINMPFDLVWLDKFEPSKPLNVKNIIGRAGRSTTEPIFDYGQIVIKESSRNKLKSILQNDIKLDNESQLDKETSTNDDYKEYKEAIKNNEFSEEYNLTNNELDRVTCGDAFGATKDILDKLFINSDIRSDLQMENEDKIMIYNDFEKLYSLYLNRQLTPAEKAILDSTIKIMIWRIIGKSFNQIVWYRYSYAARTNERNALRDMIKKTTNDDEKYLISQQEKSLEAKFIPMYQSIPNKRIPLLSLTHRIPAFMVDYDRVVFDTYDYLDKLIGFRLGDSFFAAFDKYYEKYNDQRAKKMCNYIKYGTNDEKEIMLLRYGFDFDDFEWLLKAVKFVDENEIVFNKDFPYTEEQLKRIKRFF